MFFCLAVRKGQGKACVLPLFLEDPVPARTQEEGCGEKKRLKGTRGKKRVGEGWRRGYSPKKY